MTQYWHIIFAENTRKDVAWALSFVVEKTARKFDSLAEVEKADRDFYKKLSGNQRL
jgi:hypothetical protein